jgi:hypothetical protein
MHKGRELDDDKTLAENKITTEGADVICVRKELIAEGWKILQQDDEDSDTEEEDFYATRARARARARERTRLRSARAPG